MPNWLRVIALGGELLFLLLLFLLLLLLFLALFTGRFNRPTVLLAFLLLFSVDPNRLFVAFIVLLMEEVMEFVAESAEGFDISGITGTGTFPPVKKDPMAKNR